MHAETELPDPRPYPEQLREKRARIEQAIRGYPELAALPVDAAIGAENTSGYRLRAKLAVDGRAIGLFARGSHRVVDLGAGELLDPRVAAAVAAVRAELPFEFPLLALDARAVDGGALLTLIVAPEVDEARVRAAAERLRGKHPELIGVAIGRRAPRSPQLLGSTPRTLAGAETARHHLSPEAPWHTAVAGGFVQAHAGQASRLQRAIERALAARLGSLADQPLLELYAGAGALALSLAARGARLTAADSFAPAIARLEAAAREQGLLLSALGEDAEAALATLSGTAFRAVLVNPPRRGLAPEVRQAIARHGPDHVVYVSCSPATLARDLAHFARLGYAAARVTPFDMIPRSSAVEALAVLDRAPVPAPRVIHAGAALIAVDKPPFLPTTPQGEHDDSLLARVRALPGAARAVPVHRLDLGTSGVCLFARTPEAVAALAAALAAGAKHYTALARGITRPRGNIRRPLRDGTKLRPALTRYERERVAGTHSLVTARPEQGRQHQIRRHFAGIGHPLLGDARHGDPASNRHFEQRHGLDRPFLHLARVELALAGQTLSLESPLAPDLAAVLASLELTG